MDHGHLKRKMPMMEPNQCEYVETALEHYMMKCYSLEEENTQLKKQLNKLLQLLEGTEHA
jgi:hypothetical protein